MATIQSTNIQSATTHPATTQSATTQSATTQPAKIQPPTTQPITYAPFDEQCSLFSLPALRPSPSPPVPAVPSVPNTPRPTPQPSKLTLILPAAFADDATKSKDLVLLDPLVTDNFKQYIQQDLSLTRLTTIHTHLWLAGLPRRSRPLHYQLSVGRSIVLTERADVHLVWHDDTIFLKPLPEYLMDSHVWERILRDDPRLFEDASGILLSYMWLVMSQSDFHIARENRLLSSKIEWEQWVLFSRSVLQHLDHENLNGINPRYLYGELRLPRLNLIYRFCSTKFGFKNFIRGYHYRYRQYRTFIERNFAWLLTAIIYITVVLTAMQVGLGTDKLRDNNTFNQISYGFTVFSIIAPLVVLVIVAVILAALFVYNFMYTLNTQRKIRNRYALVFENPAVLHSRSRVQGGSKGATTP